MPRKHAARFQALTKFSHRVLPSVANSALSSLGAVVAVQGAQFISGVLAARMLGPEDRGYLALLALVSLVLTMVVPLETSTALAYFTAREPSQVRSLVIDLRLIIIIQLCVCIAINFTIVWILFAGQSKALWVSGLISITVGPAVIIQRYGLAILQGLQRFGSFALFRFLPVGLYSFFLMGLFLTAKGTIMATTLAWAVAYLIGAVLVSASALRSVREQEENPSAVNRSGVVKFGLKGFLGTASPFETFRLDQIIVALLLSPVALGLYVVALAFTNLPRFVADALATVAHPYIAFQRDRTSARRAMWRFLLTTLGISTLIAVGLIISMNVLIPLVFGEDFVAAVPAAQILLVASVLFGGRRMLVESLRALGRPASGSLAEVSSWIVLLPALLLLVPKWEINGVATASALGAAAGFAAILFMAVHFSREYAARDKPFP
jgi:O-antigen/teichoic acid export membrane protein